MSRVIATVACPSRWLMTFTSCQPVAEDLGVSVFDSDGEMRNAELAQLGFNERARRGIGMLMGNSHALKDYEKRDLHLLIGP